MSSTLCAKCTLPLSSTDGYAKCMGCVKRYHFGTQCSGLSASTWERKSQTLKNEWRCESCRQKRKMEADSGKSGNSDLESFGESSDLKSVQESISSLSATLESKNSDLLSKFENNIQHIVQQEFKVLSKNMEELLKGLVYKIDDLAKSLVNMELKQNKLAEDNSLLKNKLQDALTKIDTLELKMVKSNISPLDTNNSVNATLASTVTQRSYSGVVNQTKSLGTASTLATSSVHTPVPLTSSTQSHGSSLSLGIRTTSSSDRMNNALPNSGRGEHTGNDVDSDGFRTFHNRRPRTQRVSGPPPKIGTKSSGSAALPMVRRKEPTKRTSALFISRFDPSVSVDDIKGLLTSLSLSHLVVSKLKTKYSESYSSFHVEVLEADFVKIDNVTVWPDGCLMKPYRGRLKSDVVVSPNPPGDGTPHSASLPGNSNSTDTPVIIS